MTSWRRALQLVSISRHVPSLRSSSGGRRAPSLRPDAPSYPPLSAASFDVAAALIFLLFPLPPNPSFQARAVARSRCERRGPTGNTHTPAQTTMGWTPISLARDPTPPTRLPFEAAYVPHCRRGRRRLAPLPGFGPSLLVTQTPPPPPRSPPSPSSHHSVPFESSTRHSLSLSLALETHLHPTSRHPNPLHSPILPHHPPPTRPLPPSSPTRPPTAHPTQATHAHGVHARSAMPPCPSPPRPNRQRQVAHGKTPTEGGLRRGLAVASSSSSTWQQHQRRPSRLLRQTMRRRPRHPCQQRQTMPPRRHRPQDPRPRPPPLHHASATTTATHKQRQSSAAASESAGPWA